MELRNKNTCVIGLGKSGMSAVRLLAEQGAQVCALDNRSEVELSKESQELQQLGVEFFSGQHDETRILDAELIIVSPGVPPLKVLDRALEQGTQVWSEIELASRFIEAPIVAITGTNGKSTVTSLIGEMIKQSGRDCFIGGNLGESMSKAVGTSAASSKGVVVVEVSSFQLERILKFRAHVAVLLNISPDHLDRYDDYAGYVAAKARIFECQQSDDVAIIPANDPTLQGLVAESKAQVRCFGSAEGEIRVEGDQLVDALANSAIPISEVALSGSHNLENACAAWLAAKSIGVPFEIIREVLRDFSGLPHRMQFVAERDQVRYVDDSKATNVGAAVAAVEGIGDAVPNVVLIAGGVHKGSSYEPLRDSMERYGRALVVLGEAATLIDSCFSDSELVRKHASSMRDAVEKAHSLAQPGDTVLLAPACSSFDMFSSYAQRGEAFQEAVSNLGGAT